MIGKPFIIVYEDYPTEIYEFDTLKEAEDYKTKFNLSAHVYQRVEAQARPVGKLSDMFNRISVKDMVLTARGPFTGRWKSDGNYYTEEEE